MYELEGYRVVLEKMQKRLNYQQSVEYIDKKGARLLTGDEVGLLIEQEQEKSSNKNDPFSTLQEMWCPLQGPSPLWIYIGIQISKE